MKLLIGDHSSNTIGRGNLGPAVMADIGIVSGGPISKNVHSISKYMCTNFGAFITKCTIVINFMLCRTTNSAIAINKDFMRIFSPLYTVHPR